jgi:hypothetical protein
MHPGLPAEPDGAEGCPNSAGPTIFAAISLSNFSWIMCQQPFADYRPTNLSAILKAQSQLALDRFIGMKTRYLDEYCAKLQRVHLVLSVSF